MYIHFFYYAEFYVIGNNGKQNACADGGVNLPLDINLNDVTQCVRNHILQNNPKAIESTIVVKNVSRLGIV